MYNEAVILNHHPVQNKIVYNLEEGSDEHSSSSGVLDTAETECQNYKCQSTQEKTRFENTIVGTVHNVNIADEIHTVSKTNGSSNRTRKIPARRSNDFVWET
jgi:hypothetical protein